MSEEYLAPHTHTPERRHPSTPEKFDTERLYVNQAKDEYVDAPSEITEKIEGLLKSQEHIHSHDLEKMFATADEIQGANCHKTALYLTGKIPKEMLFDIRNDDPETAGHEIIESTSKLYPDFDEFTADLLKKEFPFRISFFQKEAGKFVAKHSFTVLGVTNKQRLVGFEKQGAHSDHTFRYIEPTMTISAYGKRGYTPGLEA